MPQDTQDYALKQVSKCEYASHPSSARWPNHPTFILLGFSAALAPKFPHTTFIVSLRFQGSMSAALFNDDSFTFSLAIGYMFDQPCPEHHFWTVS